MEFKLPDIGEGVHEGEITKWLVKQGDPIKADQPMVEVMTDKATVEIPSPVTGTVEQLMAKEGQTIEVGKVLLVIKEGNGQGATKSDAAKPAPTQAKPSSATEASKPAPVARQAPAGAQARDTGSLQTTTAFDDAVPFNVLATPATRKLARDLSVSLKEVSGTGPHGRVTKEDVKLVYEGKSASTPRTSHPTASTGMTAFKPVVQKGAVQVIPLKGIRKKIAEAMTLSKHKAAHFTYVEEVDMSAIVKLRKEAGDESKRRGIKLTFLPFIIKAVIPALREFPMLNSSLDDEKQEIIVKGDYNIGIAADTPQGLVVPNIKAADSKTIWELAKEIEQLGENARAGKNKLEDLKGGTFTLTNAGSIGGVFATPIINYPEVAILGVNAIRKRPVVKNDQIVIGDVMFLSLSVDHRVVDGADAARFMNRVIYFLSEPTRLVFS